MARAKTPTVVEDQEEMTVFLVKFKGKSETLQKGFNALSQAVLGVSGSLPQQTLANPNPQQTGAVHKNGAAAVEDLDDEQELGEASESTPQREGSAQKKRYTPKFLDDFDLDGDGTEWMEYAAQKKPVNHYEKYLLAGLWLTKHGNQELFTPQHLFTCLRSAGWGDGHQDFTQPLRTMKRDKSYFDNPDGKWKLTRPGIEAAEVIVKREP
jgi:hypothetical protein